MTEILDVTKLSLLARGGMRSSSDIMADRAGGAHIVAGPLVAEVVGRLAQGMLGGTLLLMGGALTLTLWLMPVGLPLALLGVALVSAPKS